MRRHQKAINASTAFAMLLVLVAALGGETSPTSSSRQHQGSEMVWLRAKTDSGLGGGWLEMPIRRDVKLADELPNRLGEVAGLSMGEPKDQNHELHLYRLEKIDLESVAGQLDLQANQQLLITTKDLLYSDF